MTISSTQANSFAISVSKGGVPLTTFQASVDPKIADSDSSVNENVLSNPTPDSSLPFEPSQATPERFFSASDVVPSTIMKEA